MEQEKLEQFASLIRQEWNKEILGDLKALAEQLKVSIQEEEDQQLRTFLQDPENDVNDFVAQPTELHRSFNELYATYKDKRKVFAEKRAQEERDNLSRKKALIRQIESITREEENIGKAFSIFRALNEEFKEIGRVPGDQHRDITAEYHAAVDNFYYNIRIYQDLKELDLKKNLERKKELIDKIKTLSAQPITKEVEDTIKKLQSEWYNTGPVPKEDYEALKELFTTTCDDAFEKIRTFHQQRKEELKENLRKKVALLEEARTVDPDTLNTHKAWKKATDFLLKVQEQWKTVGFGPKKENEEVWAEFRTLCDRFFETKHAFYEDLHKEQDLHKVKKIELCEKAEALKENTDWPETAKKIIRLQDQWKKIGPARQRDEQKLWNRFRTACNEFFDARTRHFEGQEQQQDENLKAKKALIAEMEAIELEGAKEEQADAIKAYVQRWNQIGFVPKKEIAGLKKQYEKALDKLFDASGIDKEEMAHSRFVAKIQGLLSEEGAEQLVQKEIRFLKDKIRENQATVTQYENNMGFLSGDPNNPLVKEVHKKINQSKKITEQLENQIRLIKKLQKQHERAQQETVEKETATTEKEAEKTPAKSE